MQFFVMDQSATTDQNLYIIFLCTIDGKGKEFLNIDLGNDPPSKKTISRLKNIYECLARPHITVDLIVEGIAITRSQLVFFILDTKLTC